MLSPLIAFRTLEYVPQFPTSITKQFVFDFGALWPTVSLLVWLNANNGICCCWQYAAYANSDR